MFIGVNVILFSFDSTTEEMLQARESRKDDQNPKMVPCSFVGYVGTRPWDITLMPSPANLVRHFLEEMP